MYTISTTIVFFGLGIVMSISVNKNYLEEIFELNERALFQSANTCSATLENLYNYYYLEILESSELVELLVADEYSKELSIHFSKLNTRMTNYSNLVESSYVVNLKGDFVCSTLDTYQSLESFPDQNALECISLYQNSSMTYGLVPRRGKYVLAGKTIEKQYISLIFKKYREGYLVVNLDYDRFTDMVNYRNYNASSQTFLINTEGRVLADSNETLFAKDVTDSVYYQTLLEQPPAEGRYLAGDGAARQMINYRMNELFGISYVTITDYQRLGNNTLLIKIVLYALLAVAINLGFILAGTCFLYRPIEQLLIPFTETKSSKIDEFKLLENTFGSMKKTNKEYLNVKRKKLLREIVEDKTICEKNMLAELEHVKKSLDRQAFLCVNLYPDTEGIDNALMHFAIENIFREQLPLEIKMESIDYGNYLTCILNLNPSDQVWEKALHETQEKMQEYFHLNLTCGVGGMVNSLFDLSESYEQAQKAVFFQVTRETMAVLYFEDLSFSQTVEQKYPGEQAKAILDAIKAGDKGKLRCNIPEFFNLLTHYEYSRAVSCIFMLEMDLTRMEIKYAIHFENSEWELVEGIRQGMRLIRIQEMCLQHCLNVTDSYRETKDNNPNMKQIVDKVKAVVDENSTNPDLTVNVIAREVYLSTSYLRNIFKEVTGDTLSNYILEKRLEQVCRLLRETNLSVQQIADQMGFSSKSYLYTFFKNYMKMTPSQYRKQEVNDLWERH